MKIIKTLRYLCYGNQEIYTCSAQIIARALHHLLEWRYEGQRWPVTSHAIRDLLSVLIRRINEASGPYQMFDVLADIVLLKK